MRPFRMPPQILRLVLLTVGIVTSYLIARFFLTPPSFGQYGFYRADALEEIASRQPVFAGRQSCDKNCHAKAVETIAKGDHKTVSCESCHGNCRDHVEDRQVKVITHVTCTRCHEADPARSPFIKQIESKKHYSGERCTECHVPHQPSEVP
jgi:hypothetical protein